MWIFLLFTFVLTLKGTLAEVDCHAEDLSECVRPKLFSYVPSELSEFNALCPQLPAFMRCLKEYQDSCEGMKYFRSQDEYNEIYGAFRDVCEEGTLFNTGKISWSRVALQLK
ncbi:unnamed protein product [Larinioides sclopetarius]|uniref:Uncharacterized protein n=1 Tax=Larinioides sclopetarius TaxID=280406 RepID=A0AAV2C0R5_9ARAC